MMGTEAEFASNHEFGFDKKSMTEPSSILSFMATTWDFYGGRYYNIAWNLMFTQHLSA